MLKLVLMTFAMSWTLNGWSQYSMTDVQKLKNDKEVIITSISKKDKAEILERYQDPQVMISHTNLFYKTMLGFVNGGDKRCELKLLGDLHKRLNEEKIANSEEEIEEYLKVLRINHSIDDILYKILSGINKDYFGLKALDLDKKKKKLFFGGKKIATANDLKELFSGFSEFPDESSRCFYQEYRYVMNNLKKANGEKSEKSGDMKAVTIKAFESNLFPLATYNKIEFLRTKSNINKRAIWLTDYLRVIFNAKNKMIPIKQTYTSKQIESEDDFSSERVKRFSKLTRRELLYRKYDETQIILLSQILQKASRRMGVDVDTESKRPFISQEFSTLQPDGERQTYVEIIELDPQSQYNLARRLLRKDMTELQMMDMFVGVKITHEDIVMAAFETGYISIEELEFVIRYDDLWNPNKTRFERISGFVFKVAGYSSFFLPPPWNITVSIALGVVEGVINSKNQNGADNDNPATFIE